MSRPLSLPVRTLKLAKRSRDTKCSASRCNTSDADTLQCHRHVEFLTSQVQRTRTLNDDSMRLLLDLAMVNFQLRQQQPGLLMCVTPIHGCIVRSDHIDFVGSAHNTTPTGRGYLDTQEGCCLSAVSHPVRGVNFG